MFPDGVAVHELAYKREGIQPQQNDKALDKLFKSKSLIFLESNDFYTVRRLSHSRPYILPKGYNFIQLLAQRYFSKCETDSVSYRPFTISSLTRSAVSVKHLGEDNPNAIKNSAHLKGKTFDVSYRAFNNISRQTAAFTSALKQLRLEGKCYVKYERNGCLHITVR